MIKHNLYLRTLFMLVHVNYLNIFKKFGPWGAFSSRNFPGDFLPLPLLLNVKLIRFGPLWNENPFFHYLKKKNCLIYSPKWPKRIVDRLVDEESKEYFRRLDGTFLSYINKLKFEDLSASLGNFREKQEAESIGLLQKIVIFAIYMYTERNK